MVKLPLEKKTRNVYKQNRFDSEMRAALESNEQREGRTRLTVTA
jgi:hypothetical protein